MVGKWDIHGILEIVDTLGPNGKIERRCYSAEETTVLFNIYIFSVLIIFF